MTDQQKAPVLVAASAEGYIENVRCHIIKNPRQLRAIAALADGAKSREALDKIIGASNSPDVVSKLRDKGWDIPC